MITITLNRAKGSGVDEAATAKLVAKVIGRNLVRSHRGNDGEIGRRFSAVF